MVENAGTVVGSANHGVLQQQFQNLILAQEIENSYSNNGIGNYFTALLELPPTQAMELLTHNHDQDLDVECVPLDCGGVDPTVGSGGENSIPPFKRKERENKGKRTSKKSKTAELEEGEKLPYVHVRARRGQATDSHSLAERVRREKINARMKLLQDLVPGCNKISGTALVLDEIINHVQYLQHQVEYLSMRLAAVNSRIDFNRNSLISGNESMVDCNFPNTARPLSLMWPEIPLNGDREQFQPQWHAQSLSQPIWIKDENNHNLVASENSLMTYDSPANSVSLHSGQPKMEL